MIIHAHNATTVAYSIMVKGFRGLRRSGLEKLDSDLFTSQISSANNGEDGSARGSFNFVILKKQRAIPKLSVS